MIDLFSVRLSTFLRYFIIQLRFPLTGNHIIFFFVVLYETVVCNERETRLINVAAQKNMPRCP